MSQKKKKKKKKNQALYNFETKSAKFLILGEDPQFQISYL